MFDGLGKVSKALFCMRDQNILIATSKKLAVRSLLSGKLLYGLRERYIFDGLGKVSKALFCMRDKNILIATSKKLAVRSLQSGKLL